MTVKVRQKGDRKHVLNVIETDTHTCPNIFVLDFSSCLSEFRASPRTTWAKDAQKADRFLYPVFVFAFELWSFMPDNTKC